MTDYLPWKTVEKDGLPLQDIKELMLVRHSRWGICVALYGYNCEYQSFKNVCAADGSSDGSVPGNKNDFDHYITHYCEIMPPNPLGKPLCGNCVHFQYETCVKQVECWEFSHNDDSIFIKMETDFCCNLHQYKD